MAAIKQTKARKLFRAGHDGLQQLQSLIDALIKEAPTDKSLIGLGLVDLKVRLHKVIQENYLAELKARREEFELDDMKRARETGSALLKDISTMVEAKLKELLELHGLSDALRSLGPSKGAADKALGDGQTEGNPSGSIPIEEPAAPPEVTGDVEGASEEDTKGTMGSSDEGTTDDTETKE